MNRIGRAAAGVLPAVLVAVIVAVLALFAPSAPASGAVPTHEAAGVGAPAPGFADDDAARWGALRQPRALSGIAVPDHQLPPAVLGLVGMAVVALVALGIAPPARARSRRSGSVRLPAVRAPPAAGV